MKYEMFQSNKLTGGLFIIMGLIFLLGMSGQNILGFNPWLLIGLLPVYWIVSNIYRSYKAEGRVTVYVLYPLLFALIPLAFVAAAVLGINVNVYKLWPLGFIIGGIWFLFCGRKIN